MGGGGGFDPVSIIGNMVFGTVLGYMNQEAASHGSDTDASGAEAEAQAAEERRRADRKSAEAALLAKARQAERAGQTVQAGQAAQSLGAPEVAAASLKARLGQ